MSTFFRAVLVLLFVRSLLAPVAAVCVDWAAVALDTHAASILSSAGRDGRTEEQFTGLLLGGDACVVITSAVAVAVDALFAFDNVGIKNALLDAHAHRASPVRGGSISDRHSFPVERKLVQD